MTFLDISSACDGVVVRRRPEFPGARAPAQRGDQADSWWRRLPDEKRSLARLLIEASEHYGVDVQTLKSSERRLPVAQIRHEYCYRAVTQTHHSFAVIARAIGRDHSTALHGARVYAAIGGLPPPLRSSGRGGNHRAAAIRARRDIILERWRAGQTDWQIARGIGETHIVLVRAVIAFVENAWGRASA